MKFLKRNQLNSRNVKDNRIAVEITNEVKLDTENVLLIPNGPTTSRPGESGTLTSPVEGHIRYNTTDHEFEGRQGTPDAWRKFRFKEPALITQQNLGNGDALEVYFGPLNSGYADYPYPELTSPQNVMVYIENVFQISTTNYTLVDAPASIISVGKTDGNPTVTATQATDSMIGATITGTGIPVSTTVTGVTPGVSLTLSNAVSGAGTISATVTRSGRFVEFSSAVPYGKPVTALHGFDR